MAPNRLILLTADFHLAADRPSRGEGDEGEGKKERRDERVDREEVGAATAVHCGTKPGHFETSKIHFPTNEGVSEVSEVSERVSAGEGASEASHPEQANE